jgi:hypothetical protein
MIVSHLTGTSPRLPSTPTPSERLRRLRFTFIISNPLSLLELNTMRVTIISAAVLALFTTGANAKCTHTSGGGWNFRVYAGNKCTGKTLEYHGTQPVISGCSCFNIGSALNDKVNSFSFTGSGYGINMFKDAGCKGTMLGELPMLIEKCLVDH